MFHCDANDHLILVHISGLNGLILPQKFIEEIRDLKVKHSHWPIINTTQTHLICSKESQSLSL